jgi:FkbM family methyltransferase
MIIDKLKENLDTGKIEKSEYIKAMHSKHLLLYEYAESINGRDIEEILIKNGDVVITSKKTGVKMYASKNDMRIAPMEMLNFGAYDEFELDIINKLIPENAIFFDIGANIGWYSINIAKMKPKASIYAFEPIPNTFSSLNKNIELNEVDNIITNNHGFSEKNDTLTFYYYPEVSGNASLANLSERSDVDHIKCDVMKLDDFMKNSNDIIDFIKCDVEGAELLVFKGGIEIIKEHKPIIFSEMLRKWSAHYNYHPDDIIKLLRDVGYECFILLGDKLKYFSSVNEDTLETNFFFLHSLKHKELISLFTE